MPKLPDSVANLMTVEDVQKALGRSRASVYRYANTRSDKLNPPYEARLLNPEYRLDKEDPLLFHPNEVARFAQDILGQHVTIQVQPAPEASTHELLQAILTELQAIRTLLESD